MAYTLGNPKRVLLFEPGKHGHSATILRYVLKILQQHGIEPIVRTAQPRSSCLALPLSHWLAREAKSERADLVHLLTFDGLLKEFALGALVGNTHFPIIATQYDYAKLRQVQRQPLFEYTLSLRSIHRLMVSDPTLHAYPLSLQRKVSFLPDPWDPDDFFAVPKLQARATLGIAHDRVVFLVFGELSERKGVATILDAFAAASESNPALELLLAGTPNEKVRQLVRSLPPSVQARIQTHFRYLAEAEVSTYFHAADYVVSSSPAWYVISSGTYTRACAAGKPILAASHGVIGAEVAWHKTGLTHETGNGAQLTANLLSASRALKTPQYDQWSQAAIRLGQTRTLAFYGEALLQAYRLVLHAEASPVI